ncbi:lantibiotic dehydratase [Streptomyces sp. NPDC056716]|uniref:lantibiotic dehydratase n=1 Tax=unclassified Streptomyces TaxID=2593676 RepID=UPI0036AC7C22
MRRLFDPGPMAMARIPLRPLLGPAAENSEGLLDEGIFLASRSAEQAAPGTGRAAATRIAYDLRSRHRTTPHGVFAAVAEATLSAPAPELRLGRRHRALTALTPAWLAAETEQLLRQEPGLVRVLTLTAASGIVRRGDRLEAEHPAPGGARLASVRATDVSLWLLEATRDATPTREVLGRLADRYPGAGPEPVARAVLDMIGAGLLLTDLLPDDPRTDPLAHLLDRLPPSALARPVLVRLRQLLNDSDRQRPGTVRRRELLEQARTLADSLHRAERPLAVDTLADAKIALPAPVGAQAAEAATLLWRIGHRTPPLADYHRRFLAAYGRHRLIPVTEVLDPVTGLGPPGPADAIGTPQTPDPRRTAVLARLLADTLTAGKDELVLDDTHIDQLANPSPLPPPRTAEIHVQLFRDAGRLRVAVCPGAGSQTAGAAPGRFARHLPALVPAEAADTGSGPMIAEIVCRPRTAAAAAVTAETGAAPWRIPLDVPARTGDLRLDELAVTTIGTHLYLWSTRHRRPVTPVLHNRLASRLLPPAAHLLHLLGHAGTRPWHPWNWDMLDCWPHTPRVRYRDIVLTPARWRLPDTVTGAAGHREAFHHALHAWRADARPAPPPVLVVEEADRRLPLDLNQPEQRELLRRSIHRGTRTLAEPIAAPAELAVLDGPNSARHSLDLVIPLRRRHTPRPVQPDPRLAVRAPGTGTHLPGSTWLSTTLTAPARLHNQILTELTPLLTALPDQVDRWMWLRYTTPALGPHLRLRFHADPHTLTTRLQPALADAATRLHQSGLTGPAALRVEPYEQETERYGGPQAIAAAENLFSTDSRLALATLHHTEDERLLLAAAVAAATARTLAPDDPRTALRPGRLTTQQRSHRDTLRTRTTPSLAPTSTHLGILHTERQNALTAYRDTLTPAIAARCASDVIHLHANRMISTDPAAERIIRTLAADLLHRP